MYTPEFNPQETIITQSLGLQIASELLAEASNKATANDWLTLILVKAKTRYEELPHDELRASMLQSINMLTTSSDSKEVTEDAWDKDEELSSLDLRYTGESDEPNLSDEPSRFPFVNQDDPNKPGVGDQF